MDDNDYLHSVESWDECLVNFINCTSQSISLEWLDFEGNHVRYADSLPSLSSIKIQTYVGHPWVAYEEHFRHRRSFTSRRSVVFHPGPPSSSQDLMHGRHIDVPILTPLQSLENLCLQSIHIHLPYETDLHQLCIHPRFKNILKYLYFTQKNLNLKIRKVCPEI